MRRFGGIRKVDPLGRVVLPMDMRREMNITEGTPIEIFTEGEQIIMQIHRVECIFCGDAKDVYEYKGKKICRKCLERINKCVKD